MQMMFARFALTTTKSFYHLRYIVALGGPKIGVFRIMIQSQRPRIGRED